MRTATVQPRSAITWLCAPRRIFHRSNGNRLKLLRYPNIDWFNATLIIGVWQWDVAK